MAQHYVDHGVSGFVVGAAAPDFFYHPRSVQ
jgi:hypothetical protein